MSRELIHFGTFADVQTGGLVHSVATVDCMRPDARPLCEESGAVGIVNSVNGLAMAIGALRAENSLGQREPNAHAVQLAQDADWDGRYDYMYAAVGRGGFSDGQTEWLAYAAREPQRRWGCVVIPEIAVSPVLDPDLDDDGRLADLVREALFTPLLFRDNPKQQVVITAGGCGTRGMKQFLPPLMEGAIAGTLLRGKIGRVASFSRLLRAGVGVMSDTQEDSSAAA